MTFRKDDVLHYTGTIDNGQPITDGSDICLVIADFPATDGHIAVAEFWFDRGFEKLLTRDIRYIREHDDSFVKVGVL